MPALSPSQVTAHASLYRARAVKGQRCASGCDPVNLASFFSWNSKAEVATV